jgi:hypothetical protein
MVAPILIVVLWVVCSRALVCGGSVRGSVAQDERGAQLYRLGEDPLRPVARRPQRSPAASVQSATATASRLRLNEPLVRATAANASSSSNTDCRARSPPTNRVVSNPRGLDELPRRTARDVDCAWLSRAPVDPDRRAPGSANRSASSSLNGYTPRTSGRTTTPVARGCSRSAMNAVNLSRRTRAAQRRHARRRRRRRAGSAARSRGRTICGGTLRAGAELGVPPSHAPARSSARRSSLDASAARRPESAPPSRRRCLRRRAAPLYARRSVRAAACRC